MNKGLFAAALCCFLLSQGDSAGETFQWPQWRGPDRTDISKETGLLQSWPEEGPRRLWINGDVGIGYSGPAIYDGRLFTMGSLPAEQAMDDKGEPLPRKEFLIALDAETGEQLWTEELGDSFPNNWGDGPRGTPTVDGKSVFALGANGDLVCVRIADGHRHWHTSLTNNLGGEIPNWGYCESVLLDGDRLICTPGGEQGAMAALNKYDAKVLWRSKDFTDGAQYASIIAAENGGVRQYIQLTQQHLVGINAENGELLWSSDWQGRVAVVPTPIFHDESVYISSGYGVGCKLVELDSQNNATEAYENKNMKNHHGGVIRLGDYLYGYSDGIGWVCQNFDTGDIVWKEEEALGKGAVAYADGKLYCVEEDSGTVVLIDATPDGWKEHGRFVLDPQTELRKPAGKIWTHPVIVNGKLYLRDQELLYCYDVSAG